MGITLRDYQIENAQKVADIITNNGIAIFAGEVRIGKTLTALKSAENINAKEVLFVTKKKAIASIDKDYSLLYPIAAPFNMVVVNFEQLHKVEPGFDYVIIDECHNIGTFPKPSARATELKRICKNNCRVLLMSGTISPESFSQLYHQFYITENSPWNAYTSFYKWAAEYVKVKQRIISGNKINDYSHAIEEKVMADIAHLMLAYTQVEAGFECIIEEHVMEYTPNEKVLWAVDKLRKDRVFTTKAGHEILADTSVKLMQKEHQIWSGTVKSESGEMIVFDEGKAAAIKEKFAGQKIAIFYKYVAESISLRNCFSDAIVATPELFNEAGPGAVYISQLQAGREGIDLATADALIMYNIDFSAVSYWQARARLQTKDRLHAAPVYWVFSKGGIEQKIYDVVMGKKDFTLRHYLKGVA